MLSRQRVSSVSKVQFIGCELSGRYIGPTPPVQPRRYGGNADAGTGQINEFPLLSLAAWRVALYRLLLMRHKSIPPLLLACLLVISSVRADDNEAGFIPLFNGRDLSGWVNVNCAPSTYTVRDGMIFCTG